MSKLKRALMQASSGASGGAAEATYVDDLFSTYLYEGDGVSNADFTINNGIDLDGEGGMVWVKRRDATENHAITDTTQTKNSQGVGFYPYLQSQNAQSLSANDEYGINAFTSTGFTLRGRSGPTANEYNTSGADHVSWTFRKQPGFFDIVTYTGDGSTNKTISHNLGSTPGMIIVKCTSANYRWNVWHRDLTNALTNTNPSLTMMLFLNTTDDQQLTGSGGVADVNDSTFDVGGVFANDTGETFVAYIFAHDAQDFGTDSDESIVYCGTYEGDGTAVNEITLGWEPQWVLIKDIDDSSGNWILLDIMRGASVGGDSVFLEANSTDADNVGASPTKWYPTPTGFVVDSGAGGANDTNDSGETYIFVAIRRPHKPAEEFAATDLFAIDTRNSTGDGNEPGFRSGFPVDMNIFNPDITGTNAHRISGRLTGDKYLESSSNNAELTGSTTLFDYMNGWLASGGTSANAYSWMFRRAPGFFDVVAYTGDGTNPRYVNHNLDAIPRMIWLKRRDSADDWFVWALKEDDSEAYFSQSASSSFGLNTDRSTNTNTTYSPALSLATSTTFRPRQIPGGSNDTNLSGATYIAYLFGSVPGISKVGSYSGTGATQTIDCGFSSGARFVLIKSTTYSGGAWFLFDTERGITTTAPTSPFLTLNSNSAESSSSVLEPDSTGFKIIATGNGTNGSGQDYIFLAIA
jgi:hypothetical protein